MCIYKLLGRINVYYLRCWYNNILLANALGFEFEQFFNKLVVKIICNIRQIKYLESHM